MKNVIIRIVFCLFLAVGIGFMLFGVFSYQKANRSSVVVTDNASSMESEPSELPADESVEQVQSVSADSMGEILDVTSGSEGGDL